MKCKVSSDKVILIFSRRDKNPTLKKIDYNYGFKIARLFNDLFKCVLSSNFKSDASKKLLLSLKEFYPQRWERLKGLADALGICMGSLYMNTLYLSRLMRGGCTAGFCAPPATKDGNIYLFWNIDFFKAAQIIGKFFRFYLFDVPGYNCYLAFGIPGLVGVPIINEFGLAVVSASVGMKDGGGEGVMDAEILSLCMERSKDINEVIDIYKNTKLASFPGVTGGSLLNLNSIWADRNGQGLIIEHSSHHLHFELAKDGILAIANHHQFIRELTGSPTPDELPSIAGSYCRLGRMWHLLRENKGKIDLDLIKKFMADHKLEKEHVDDYKHIEPIDDGTICVHYWHLKQYLREGNFKRAIETYLMGKTVGSIIIEPKSLTIHTCSGNPCNHHYKHTYLEPAFLHKKFPRIVNEPTNPLLAKLFRKMTIGLATLLERFLT